ncbi:alpha-L-glutamate ligase [Streptomyces sp. NPDC023588]|uniref:ATP-grasp domain-containing protein n=1 Tax=Streptomyces sp. NPDC023588 TaxID=3154907 RepID=UPI0033F9C024
MTDHSSTEGSREYLAAAVEQLTGRPAVLVDAGHFMPGESGELSTTGSGDLCLCVPAEGLALSPSAVIVYEIPPASRRGFEAFQHRLRAAGARTLGDDAQAWRTATEKDLTVARFRRDGIPHMETVPLRRPSPEQAVAVFERLGGDVWARPVMGMGGDDVFHITTPNELHTAAASYASTGANWLLARDAGNFNADGLRHQYRVVVLDGEVIQACEHIQSDPDRPCNESQGAVSTLLSTDDLPPGLAELATAATRSVGLRLGGVDLALENGGVVFEVNVHPAFGDLKPLETVALPYVQAHLSGDR